MIYLNLQVYCEDQTCVKVTRNLQNTMVANLGEKLVNTGTFYLLDPIWLLPLMLVEYIISYGLP